MLVEVTYACKMGCTHCLSDCKPDGEHMTLEVFEDVLKFMIKNQIPTWSFSGGEMFEHPDILKMLHLSNHIGRHYRLSIQSHLQQMVVNLFVTKKFIMQFQSS